MALPPPLPTGFGPARQGEVYMKAMLGGQRPIQPISQAGLHAAARAKITPEAWAYIAGGAGSGATIDANRTALDRWQIVPRMLRDVSVRDLSVSVLGKPRAHPLMIAPIGVQEMVHEDADLATATAAKTVGVPMIISNQASFPMEAIAAELGDTPFWFQLYWGKSDALVASLVRRAEACGAEAIVVTLDTSILGWRTQDLDLGFLPFLKAQGIAQYTSDPVFRGLLGDNADDKHAQSVLFMTTYSNPALTWDKLAYLRDHTKLPIFLKGINHRDDAARAVALGMDGLIVSNHGGRQVDGAIGAIDALEHVALAAAGRVPVLFDSGIRGGADIFKALALGATSVLIGRPYIYGLALNGANGVASVLTDMLAELDLTLGLAGCASIAEVTREMLTRA